MRRTRYRRSRIVDILAQSVKGEMTAVAVCRVNGVPKHRLIRCRRRCGMQGSDVQCAWPLDELAALLRALSMGHIVPPHSPQAMGSVERNNSCLESPFLPSRRSTNDATRPSSRGGEWPRTRAAMCPVMWRDDQHTRAPAAAQEAHSVACAATILACMQRASRL